MDVIQNQMKKRTKYIVSLTMRMRNHTEHSLVKRAEKQSAKHQKFTATLQPLDCNPNFKCKIKTENETLK